PDLPGAAARVRRAPFAGGEHHGFLMVANEPAARLALIDRGRGRELELRPHEARELERLERAAYGTRDEILPRLAAFVRRLNSGARGGPRPSVRSARRS